MITHVKKTKAAIPLGPVPKIWFGAKFKEGQPVIRSVAKNSLAEKCGLLEGDRIVKFGDATIMADDDFQKAQSVLERGGTVETSVLRQDPVRLKNLTLFVVVPAWVSSKVTEHK